MYVQTCKFLKLIVDTSSRWRAERTRSSNGTERKRIIWARATWAGKTGKGRGWTQSSIFPIAHFELPEFINNLYGIKSHRK